MGVDCRLIEERLKVKGKPRAYIIRNSRLLPDWVSVDPPKTLAIAGRATASLIRSEGIGDLYRMYLVALRDGVDYHWPGNVRELENVIERAMILNPTGPLTFEHLNPEQKMKTLELGVHSEETDNLDEVISRHIRRVLSKTKGKVNGPDGATAFLGINPSTLRNRMKKLGIDYGRKSKS